jgi:hypothetical protein
MPLFARKQIRNTGETGFRILNPMTPANIQLRGPFTRHDVVPIASFDRGSTSYRAELKYYLLLLSSMDDETIGLTIET